MAAGREKVSVARTGEVVAHGCLHSPANVPDLKVLQILVCYEIRRQPPCNVHGRDEIDSMFVRIKISPKIQP